MTSYRKACTCEGATATCGQMRTEHTAEMERVVFTIIMIPGPSCDACGTPWKRVETTAERRR